jgi:hypothetical protein
VFPHLKGTALETNLQVYYTWVYLSETNEVLRYLLLLAGGSYTQNSLSRSDLAKLLFQWETYEKIEHPQIVLTRESHFEVTKQEFDSYMGQLKRLSDVLSSQSFFNSDRFTEEELCARIRTPMIESDILHE